jgi:Terminase large subunit, T4likevirus-type, N-terminal
MSIIDAILDLWSAQFSSESWRPWLTALAALFGLPLPGADASVDTYRRCTGRTLYAVGHPAREGWFVVGRRGGKSRIAALVAVFLACFHDYRPHLALGEVGTVAVIAADRRQARVIMRYIVGFLDSVPMLKAMIANRTKECIELSNRITIEVHTASFRAVRGYTLVAAICDELAFWQTDEDAANPDAEILGALRPGLATIPGGLLLCISSPYARRGALWDAYRKHYGKDGDAVLVWQAPTEVMNPAVDRQVITHAYVADPAAAAAEYGAQFRRDIETFIAREAVDAVVIPGRRELPPVWPVRYVAFVDPSGGAQDSMTLAIAHRERGQARVVLDGVCERRAPFNPSDVVSEFAQTLKTYHVGVVTGDRYAGEWPRERFRAHGIEYRVAERVRSELYRDLLPLLTSRQVELLDHPRLIAQLCGLERRTARSGKDSIDHAPGAHDDIINAAAGAIVACHGTGQCTVIRPLVA